jgi:hypothetical protein
MDNPRGFTVKCTSPREILLFFIFFSLMKKRKKKNQEKISLPPHKPAQARPIPASRQAGFLACAHEMLKL